jgi:hypothetical protein
MLPGPAAAPAAGGPRRLATVVAGRGEAGHGGA